MILKCVAPPLKIVPTTSSSSEVSLNKCKHLCMSLAAHFRLWSNVFNCRVIITFSIKLKYAV